MRTTSVGGCHRASRPSSQKERRVSSERSSTSWCVCDLLSGNISFHFHIRQVKACLTGHCYETAGRSGCPGPGSVNISLCPTGRSALAKVPVARETALSANTSKSRICYGGCSPILMTSFLFTGTSAASWSTNQILRGCLCAAPVMNHLLRQQLASTRRGRLHHRLADVDPSLDYRRPSLTRRGQRRQQLTRGAGR